MGIVGTQEGGRVQPPSGLPRGSQVRAPHLKEAGIERFEGFKIAVDEKQRVESRGARDCQIEFRSCAWAERDGARRLLTPPCPDPKTGVLTLGTHSTVLLL